MKNKLIAILALTLPCAYNSPLATAQAQGTAFTYQGRLNSGGSPVSGSYDLAFGLWRAASGPPQIGSTVTNTATAVSNGLFTVTLDFGANFPGADRWLEIGVRAKGGAFSWISPRQPITATPYAITAGAVTGPVAAGQLTGSLPVSQMSGTVPLTQIPSAVVTNGASGVDIAGTFTGNGAGLSNVSVANLVGLMADARLSANIPRLNVPNTAAVATGVPIRTGGLITSASVTSGGSGYLTPPLVAIGDTTGAGASLTALLNGGSVTSLHVVNPGSNYSSAVTLTIAPPPSNAFQTFSTTNFFTGATTMTNADNRFVGSFTGSGAGLTDLPAPPLGMVLIPAGAFTMGNSIAADTDIVNAATVTTTVSAFYMDVNLVSWSQWQPVYYWAVSHFYSFENVGAGKAPNHPVQTVDWYDTVKWCNARSQKAGRTPVYYTDAGFTHLYRTGEVTVYANWAANGYRLPTEAEWEKAARGRWPEQRFPWGDVINQNLAHYSGDTAHFSYDLGPNGLNAAFTDGGPPYTSPVGSFAANGYGLNDMAGNVFQWCWDWYGFPYAGGTDPRGVASGSYRVYRGGGWGYNASDCRAAYRNYYVPTLRSPSLGFRSVLPQGQ